MSADGTREALAAMVREGKAAGMYADDHGSAGFCTGHGQPAQDVAAIRARCCRDWPVLAMARMGRCGYCGQFPVVVAIPFGFAVPVEELRAALAAAPGDITEQRAAWEKREAYLRAIGAPLDAPSETETGR